MFQSGNGGFVLQAFPQAMNIKIDRSNELRVKEMISRNSRYGDARQIVHEAIEYFYLSEKKKRFR